MPLSKETKSRIQKEAKEYSSSANVNLAYKAGATEEAERAAGLVECLNSIKAIGHPDQRVLNLIVLTLTKYNNSK